MSAVLYTGLSSPALFLENSSCLAFLGFSASSLELGKFAGNCQGSFSLCHYLKFSPGRKLRQSVQFSSVAQSCQSLCDPINHSTPGLPVHHQLPEFTQTHAHRVGDAIQPSHPLPSPSPPAPSPSQLMQ